jgi:DEAD/DEAH box helicase domain-containing protein
MFKKIKFGSRDSLGYGSLDLPPLTLLTTGFWIVPPREAYGYVREAGRVPREGLLGVANVMKEVIPVFVMCDTMDVGASVDSSAADAPALFVYDRYPGGLGFAHKVYEMIEEVMEGSLELLDKCPCGDGCPSCVGSPIPAYSQNDPDGESRGMIPDKEAAKSILHYLLEKEPYVPARAAKGAARVPAAEAPAAVFPKDMKELPIALEKKLRERMSRYKRNARR